MKLPTSPALLQAVSHVAIPKQQTQSLILVAARQKTGDNKATDQNESNLIVLALLIQSDKTNADYLQVYQLHENVIRLT